MFMCHGYWNVLTSSTKSLNHDYLKSSEEATNASLHVILDSMF